MQNINSFVKIVFFVPRFGFTFGSLRFLFIGVFELSMNLKSIFIDKTGLQVMLVGVLK